MGMGCVHVCGCGGVCMHVCGVCVCVGVVTVCVCGSGVRTMYGCFQFVVCTCDVWYTSLRHSTLSTSHFYVRNTIQHLVHVPGAWCMFATSLCASFQGNTSDPLSWVCLVPRPNKTVRQAQIDVNMQYGPRTISSNPVLSSAPFLVAMLLWWELERSKLRFEAT